MPIPVVCQCGAKFAAKDELAGRAVKCPKCTQPIKIPGTAPGKDSAVTSDKAPANAKPTTPTQPAAPVKKATPPAPQPAVDNSIGNILDEIGVAAPVLGNKCPSCQSPMPVEAVLCIACGYNAKTKKKVATRADSDAKKRREEMYAQQAAKAAAASKAALAKQPNKSSTSSSNYSDKPEPELGVADYLFCILCNGCAFWVAIYYLVSGNPRASAFLKLWATCWAIMTVLGFALGAIIGAMSPAAE